MNEAMKQSEVLNAYRVLGEVVMTTLEVSDVMKVFKARAAMRPVAESVEAFLKDVQEKSAAWESMSDEQRAELNKAVNDELMKEVDVTFEKLDVEALAKMTKENGFKPREMEMLGVVI